MESPWKSLSAKARRVARWKHPEPGTVFSYEDWKAGQHNNKAVVDILRQRNDTWFGSRGASDPVTPPHTP